MTPKQMVCLSYTIISIRYVSVVIYELKVGKALLSRPTNKFSTFAWYKKKTSHDMTFTCDLKCSMSPIKAINVLLYLQYTSQEKLPVIINAITLTIFPDFVQISHMSLQIIETQMPVTI